MPAPTVGELARLRADTGIFLSEECQVQRATATRTASGGLTETVVTIDTVPCRRTSRGNLTPTEQTVATRLKSQVVWDIYVPAETAIRPTDKLQIGGRRYEIVSVTDRTVEIQRWIVAVELV